MTFGNSFENVSNIVSTFQNPEKSMNLASIFKTNDISFDVQQQLVQTYTVLLLALSITSTGILLHLWVPIGGLLTLCVSFIPLFVITCEKDKSDLRKRTLLLCIFGFLQGLSLGPLLSMGLSVDPFLVFLSFVCTSIIFGSFSLAALMATRRSYLYLGGFLSSAMAVVAIIGIANILVQSVHFYIFHLYAGLFIFSGFVIFDTQMIIEVGTLFYTYIHTYNNWVIVISSDIYKSQTSSYIFT